MVRPYEKSCETTPVARCFLLFHLSGAFHLPPRQGLRLYGGKPCGSCISFHVNIIRYICMHLKNTKNMKTKLSKHSIAELLKEQGEMSAEGTVYSKILNKTMSLIGFVPYYESLSLDYTNPEIFASATLAYAPYRIRLVDSQLTFPVMKNIRLSKEGEIFTMDKSLVTAYDGEHGFNRFITYYNELEKYITSVKKGTDRDKHNLNLYANEIANRRYSIRLFVNEDCFLCYKTVANELISTRTLGNLTEISNSFLCLCAYPKADTEQITYTLFDPEDIYLVAEQSSNE